MKEIMAKQGLSVEQKRQQRRLKKLAKKYGFAWTSETERLAKLPDDLWAWVEEKLTLFTDLQEALRSPN